LLLARDPSLHTVSSIDTLVQYLNLEYDYLNESEIRDATNELKKSMGSNIVLFIDGYDECPTDCKLKGFIHKLIQFKCLPKCLVIITSRPHASLSLHSLKNLLRIEILGFDKIERDKYISESLQGEDYSEKKAKLDTYLKLQPAINSITYVPLHLAVLLYLFKVCKMPETLTELNEQFIIHTIYWHLEEKEQSPIQLTKNIKDLPEHILNVVKKLANLAARGLGQHKLVFSYDEVTEVCPEMDAENKNGYGLLQVVQHHVASGAGHTFSFNFIHLTMQEFLTAYHFSILPLNWCGREFGSFSSNYVWIMYVGLVGADSDAFIQYQKSKGCVVSGKSSESHLKNLFIFQCYLEAKSLKKVPEDISSAFRDGSIEIHETMKPYNIVSLVNFMLKSTAQFTSLNLSNSGITDEGLTVLCDFITDHTDKLSSFKHVCLSHNHITSLWGSYSESQPTSDELKRKANSGLLLVPCVNISSNLLKENGVKELFTALKHNKTLLQLDISSNDVPYCALLTIGESLKINSTLQELNLSHNNLLDKGIRLVSDCLKTNHSLRVLEIAGNNITDEGAFKISETLRSNTTLSTLNVSKNWIHKKGVMSILTASARTRALKN